jgi:general secretion pathway protein H
MTTTKKSGTGSAGGFTLLELLVVLAILVMAAALFPLALNRALPARRVSTTVDRLVAAVHEAQAESVTRGLPVTLTLVGDGLEASAKSARALLRPVKFSESVHVDLRDGNGQAATSLTVFPDGSAQGGQYQIAAGEHLSLVQVSGLTGRVDARRER